MKNKLKLIELLKGLILAFLITFILIFIISILLKFTGLREAKLGILNNIVIMLSIVISSIYVVLRVRKNGWLYGAILGLIYYLVIILINIVFYKANVLAPISIFKLIIIMIIGAIGGIIGVNLI